MSKARKHASDARDRWLVSIGITIGLMLGIGGILTTQLVVRLVLGSATVIDFIAGPMFLAIAGFAAWLGKRRGAWK